MCCIFRQHVVQNDLCVYLSWLLLSLMQCCAISYNVITTLVRLMIMVVTTKYGRNSGSLKNKTHFLNWSQGSGASGSIVLVARSHFVCWHTHTCSHTHITKVLKAAVWIYSHLLFRESSHIEDLFYLWSVWGWDQEGKPTNPLVSALQLHSNRKVQILRSVVSDLCKRLTSSSTLNEPEWNMCKCALVLGLIVCVIRRRSFV